MTFDIVNLTVAAAALILGVLNHMRSKRRDAPFLQLDVNLTDGSTTVTLVNRGGGAASIISAALTYKEQQFSLMDTAGIVLYISSIYWHDRDKIVELPTTTNNLDFNGRLDAKEKHRLFEIPHSHNGVEIHHEMIAALQETSWLIECKTIHDESLGFSGPYIHRYSKPPITEL